MIYSDKIRDVMTRPYERGRCFTGLEIAAIAGVVSSVAGVGMSIIGASQQADAQREAGEVAYQQALIRNQQAQAEAKRLEDKANAEQAAAQRQAIEEKRKATILASRAQAVMASSGAGVDTNILDGILAEGEYGFDTALYEGDTRAHLAGESERFKVATFKDLNALDLTEIVQVADNPAKVDVITNRIERRTRAFYEDRGLPGEAAAAAASSDALRSVIETQAASGNGSQALSLFRKYANRLDAKDRLALMTTMRTVEIGETARSQALDLVSSVPTTASAEAGTKASLAFWKGEYGEKVSAGITAGFLRESQFSTGARRCRCGYRRIQGLRYRWGSRNLTRSEGPVRGPVRPGVRVQDQPCGASTRKPQCAATTTAVAGSMPKSRTSRCATRTAGAQQKWPPD